MTLQQLGTWLTKEERVAIKHAFSFTKAATTADLIKIFDAGLGMTEQGRKILNAKHFNMSRITLARSAVQ